MPLLHDPALAQHHHPVGEVPHHGQVVPDEQVADAEVTTQFEEQVDDLGLHGEVEGGSASSQMIRSGETISARAIAIRWRWPPENCRG